MKLYHGTSSKHLDSILKRGICPRGGKKSNWDMASRHDAVYLSACYAPYFAIQATRSLKHQPCIIEIETDVLPHALLVPDEDAIEQIMRGKDKVKGDMETRTAWYRDRLHMFTATPDWLASIRALGNCAYLDYIPPYCITDIITVDYTEGDARKMLGLVLDPTITVMNMQVAGGYYRDLTHWFFARNHQEFLRRSRRDRGQFGGDCWRDLPGFYTKRLKLYRETGRTGIVHHGACSKPTPLVALDWRKAAGCSSAW